MSRRSGAALDGPAREGLPGHGDAGLLRRSPLALAEAQQREHYSGNTDPPADGSSRVFVPPCR
ncbi:hypothetical protein J8J19_24205, partial [Mycobacterium tuberculosis]|nr:hypothetical protein [Mycobacterium tuberculosis]